MILSSPIALGAQSPEKTQADQVGIAREGRNFTPGVPGEAEQCASVLSGERDGRGWQVTNALRAKGRLYPIWKELAPMTFMWCSSFELPAG